MSTTGVGRKVYLQIKITREKRERRKVGWTERKSKRQRKKERKRERENE